MSRFAALVVIAAPVCPRPQTAASRPRHTMIGVKRCAAYQCAEPAAALAVPYCATHQQLVSGYRHWLDGSHTKLIPAGDARATDPAASFDVARASWEDRPREAGRRR